MRGRRTAHRRLSGPGYDIRRRRQRRGYHVAAGPAGLHIRSKEKQDRMHSFVVAEILKYAYLLFAPPETLNLQRVIFNTEAHPLKPVR